MSFLSFISLIIFKVPVSMCPICESINGESVQLQNLLETSVSKFKYLMDCLKPIVLQGIVCQR